MKSFRVVVEGTSALLIHRFGEDAQESGSKPRSVHVEEVIPREQAAKVAYIRGDGTMFMPGGSFGRAMREAGANHKQRGSRRTFKYILPAAVRVQEDDITILGADGLPVEGFEVDSRPVTIPATKGRVMRHRPKYPAWRAAFTIIVNETLVDPKFAHQLLVEAGLQIGVGDFRPEKGGPFGTFNVIEWSEIGRKAVA